MGVLGDISRVNPHWGPFWEPLAQIPAQMGGGVKSCAELLSGLVMEQEIFPGVVALRQAGTHCLAVERWEHNAQVPHCAGLHGLPLAAP